jgi:ABC-type glycerol-3-phosphate transport system permease component
MIRLGWVDTYKVMILPMAANAFAVFLVRQYLKDLPDEYLEMARVLGADEFRIYFQIILPMMRPILATSAVFIALRSWNNYLWPLVMMRSERMYTFSVGLTTIQDPHEIKYGLLMAGATISILPMLVFFLSLQKQYVSSISRGALK